jgi:deazaflavin-dependent oxidoreductase (nitroreductase family)
LKILDHMIVSFARSRFGAWMMINVVWHIDRPLLQWSRGRLSTGIGTRLHDHGTLLTTTGARSGRSRTVPVLSFEDDDDLIMIASRGAHPRHPGWYFNLKANPQCTVTIKGKASTRIAREAEGGERERLWKKGVALYPGWDDYRHRTDRRMPVMILSLTEGERPADLEAVDTRKAPADEE